MTLTCCLVTCTNIAIISHDEESQSLKHTDNMHWMFVPSIWFSQILIHIQNHENSDFSDQISDNSDSRIVLIFPIILILPIPPIFHIIPRKPEIIGESELSEKLGLLQKSELLKESELLEKSELSEK